MITLPKAMTSDCYGTLIDWESGLQQFFAQRLAAHHLEGLDPRALQHKWEEIQFVAIQQPYRPYRQVLHETMRMTLESWQIPYAEQDLEEFATAMGSWPPFPDTHQALLELQKLTKTVLLTNTDDEIIAQTERTIGVKFDDIITPTERGDTTVWVSRQGEARPRHVHETFLVGDLRTLLYLVKGMAAEM